MTEPTEPTDVIRVAYVYAVLRPTPQAAQALSGVLGVAGEPVRLVEPEDGRLGLAAAVGHVPACDFEEEPLKAHLEDLGWLEGCARAHHAVVAALSNLGTAAVLPLRLATVYRDDDRVRQTLRDRRCAFLPLLDRLTGHVELGVKVYVQTAPVPAPSAPAPAASEPVPAAGASLSPGRAYLAGRRRQRRGVEDAWRAASLVSARIADEARTVAVEHVSHRPQRAGLPGTDAAGGENVANDAYLVPAGHVEDFRTRVLAAAEDLPGVRVELTGPWAPYSFALPPEDIR